MGIRTILTASLAMALAAAPAALQAEEAPIERASAPAGDSAELGGSSLFFLAAIAAVALGIVLLIDDDDAVSP